MVEQLQGNVMRVGGATQLQNAIKNQLMAERAKKRFKETIILDEMLVATSDIMQIKGIGKKSAEKLLARGIDTREKLAELTEEEIGDITGNPLTAKGLMNAVKNAQ